MQRRLAAILSADVVGYSGMMERDEAGTLERLKANRRAIFDPKVAEHGGRIVKLMGDGALVEFASVVSAVTCAVEIQHAIEKADAKVPEDERIRYRIGVNLGDVIVEGGDIYGDGVNVAARLQMLAHPGCVALSRTVRDQVTGKIAAEFEDIGEHAVKNIERPVHVFMMRCGAVGTAAAAAEKDQAPRLAICVLPFANISGDPEQEYFSDGITEDIITDLSKVSALSVVSRNTAFSYKGKPLDVAQIARQLHVSHVLEGSVRKVGNRVRITGQLIEGATDSHVWAERYDRDLNDIFAVQDEISEAIVGALKLKLLPSEKKAIETRSTTNAEAYKLYLMARHYLLLGSARHRPLVVRLCRRAVEIDPGYARAWALMAISQSNIRLLSSQPSESGWDAAQKALSLQPDLAEAHAARGRILADLGRYAEAAPEHETALRLDPDSYEVNAAAGRYALAVRRYEDAIRYFEKAASILESDFWAVGMTIQVYRALGQVDRVKEAARRTLQHVEKIIAAEPDHGTAMGFGVMALAALGDKDRAKEWAERATLLDPDNVNLRYNLGCSMVRLGDFDAAFELLEPVFRTSTVEALQWYRTDTDLDPIRDDPRFKSMLKALEEQVEQPKPEKLS